MQAKQWQVDKKMVWSSKRRINDVPGEPDVLTSSDYRKQLGLILSEHWTHNHVDREQLCKDLVLSKRQLDAIEVADPSFFHTDGLYIEALRRALTKASLSEREDVQTAMQALVLEYQQSPRGLSILEVQKRLNRTLGEAPNTEPVHKPIIKGSVIVAALLCLIFVIVLVNELFTA